MCECSIRNVVRLLICALFMSLSFQASFNFLFVVLMGAWERNYDRRGGKLHHFSWSIYIPVNCWGVWEIFGEPSPLFSLIFGKSDRWTVRQTHGTQSKIQDQREMLKSFPRICRIWTWTQDLSYLMSMPQRLCRRFWWRKRKVKVNSTYLLI